MEKVTFRNILSNIKSTMDALGYAKYRKDIAIKNRWMGKYQAASIEIRYLERKLQSLKGQLRDKMVGTIIKVTYELTYDHPDNPIIKRFEQTFLNLPQQEIHDILHISAMLEGASIKILEIKVIPTQIKEL